MRREITQRERAVAALTSAHDLQDSLDEAHDAGARPPTIGRLNQHLGIALRAADVHATLAVAEAVHELGRLLQLHPVERVGGDFT